MKWTINYEIFPMRAVHTATIEGFNEIEALDILKGEVTNTIRVLSIKRAEVVASQSLEDLKEYWDYFNLVLVDSDLSFIEEFIQYYFEGRKVILFTDEKERENTEISTYLPTKKIMEDANKLKDIVLEQNPVLTVLDIKRLTKDLVDVINQLNEEELTVFILDRETIHTSYILDLNWYGRIYGRKEGGYEER